jgi:hypothetical protein
MMQKNMMAVEGEMDYRGSVTRIKDLRHCDVLCRCGLGLYESEQEDRVLVIMVNHEI